MLSAKAAVFAQLDAIRRIFLAFHRVIVALLAFRASQANLNTRRYSHCGHLLMLLRVLSIRGIII
jgi:hypothetical protein